MKTARFAQIVAQCGRPSPHLSWVAPEKDHALMTAAREHRVMTVHQASRGPHKDYATVGLIKSEAGGQILVFPKSLRRFADRRIVGINYDLLADADKMRPASESADTARRRKSEKLPPAAWRETPGSRSAVTPAPKARADASSASRHGDPSLQRASVQTEDDDTSRRDESAAPESETPRPRKAAAPPVPTLTWREALSEIEAARAEIARRPQRVKDRLSALAQRMTKKLNAT